MIHVGFHVTQYFLLLWIQLTYVSRADLIGYSERQFISSCNSLFRVKNLHMEKKRWDLSFFRWKVFYWGWGWGKEEEGIGGGSREKWYPIFSLVLLFIFLKLSFRGIKIKFICYFFQLVYLLCYLPFSFSLFSFAFVLFVSSDVLTNHSFTTVYKSYFSDWSHGFSHTALFCLLKLTGI